MKISQAHAYCQNKQSDGAIQQLGQHHLLECYMGKLNKEYPADFFMSESDQSSLGHKTNTCSAVFKYLYAASSAIKLAWKDALQISVVEKTSLKDHFFDQVDLLDVTYDSNNSQILLCYTVVIYQTDIS